MAVSASFDGVELWWWLGYRDGGGGLWSPKVACRIASDGLLKLRTSTAMAKRTPNQALLTKCDQKRLSYNERAADYINARLKKSGLEEPKKHEKGRRSGALVNM